MPCDGTCNSVHSSCQIGSRLYRPDSRPKKHGCHRRPLCFEFTNELQDVLATYPRKKKLSESISVVFVGKVASFEHARNVVAKSRRLKVSTKVVTHWTELLAYMWKQRFTETDADLPAWDDRWAEHQDDGENGDGSVPRVLDSVNECCLESADGDDDAGKDLTFTRVLRIQ